MTLIMSLAFGLLAILSLIAILIDRFLPEHLPGCLSERRQTYYEQRYCGVCDKPTRHRCLDDGYQRQTSEDFEECLDCGRVEAGPLKD